MLTEQEMDELIEHLRKIEEDLQNFQMVKDEELIGIRDYGVGEDPGPLPECYAVEG